MHLGTLHGAKGLELPHVFVLDDGMGADSEPERRLLYVGLTCARETTALVLRQDRPDPLIAGLVHPALLERTWAGEARWRR